MEFVDIKTLLRTSGPAPDLSVPESPVQPEKWPLWALGFKRLSKPGDRGIGDTVARIIGPVGSYSFKKWHKRLFRQDCGCTGRQDKWNRMYPLP